MPKGSFILEDLTLGLPAPLPTSTFYRKQRMVHWLACAEVHIHRIEHSSLSRSEISSGICNIYKKTRDYKNPS